MDLINLIRHPELMDRETLYDLRSLIAQYPYYQTARLLMLKNLYILHDPTFDENGNLRGFPKDVRDTLKGFYDGWKKWIQENINDRGLHLRRNMMGTPIAIYLVVAGDDKAVYLAENI